MSFARFRVPTAENISYTGEYVNFAPSSLSNVTNQDKYLRNDQTGNLIWEGVNTANKLCRLDNSGLVNSANLPSYVDDVMEYAVIACYRRTRQNICYFR